MKTAHKEGRKEERGCQQKRHSQGKKSKKRQSRSKAKGKKAKN